MKQASDGSVFSWSERLIAGLDEIDIEAALWDAKRSEGRLLRQISDRLVLTLKDIDRLKIERIYEVERKSIVRRIYQAGFTPAELLPVFVKDPVEAAFSRKDYENIRNFLCGLKSHNDAQRRRLQDFYHALNLGEVHVSDELVAMVAPLEKAVNERGRPSAIPPWRNVVTMLDEIRLSLASGKNLALAAKDASDKPQDSRIEYLCKKYRQREALRE